MRKIGKKREKEQSASGQFRFPFHGLARGGAMGHGGVVGIRLRPG